MNKHFELEGRYRLVVRRPDGEVRLDTGWFHNLILDQGLEALGTMSSGHFNRGLVGSGSTAPAAGQTTLAAKVAHDSGEGVPGYPKDGVDLVNNFAYVQYLYRFLNGAAAGNLSEVGVGWNTTSLFSRALILDQSNNPTSITVLPDETLDLVYEIRLYPKTTDTVGSITLAGTTHTTTTRPAVFSSQWAGGFRNRPGFAFSDGVGSAVAFTDPGNVGLGVITADPGGSYLGTSTSISVAPYVNGSRKATITVTAGLNAWNNVIHHIRFAFTAGYYKTNFNPPINKTSSQILKFTYEISWARKAI